jgi:hypothetical protein
MTKKLPHPHPHHHDIAPTLLAISKWALAKIKMASMKTQCVFYRWRKRRSDLVIAELSEELIRLGGARELQKIEEKFSAAKNKKVFICPHCSEEVTRVWKDADGNVRHDF